MLKALRRPNVSLDALMWSYAQATPTPCTGSRDRDPRQVRSDIIMSRSVNDENPEEWTVTEAIPIAAACPDQLVNLYRMVALVGYPDAARRAQARVTAAMKQL